ncbi:UDP-N-acetylmuramate dehydrogenase [uncultured Desulfovibrio sp.]|uniref:UDP-N-acetylmuramate dehydrogenase n=1 Tax=uncultured Desulfovibrio sp. TaxID=167968 RepID=UPI0025E7663A|nr:UDP-N-acetylmuramate dehydrogenase [uncultured Desulfovibrio sp.]
MRETPSPLLAERTSIRLGGRAIAELHLEAEDDVFRLAERQKQLGGRLFFLGAGTNILAADGDLPVILVRYAEEGEPTVVRDEGERVMVRVGASVPLPRLLRFCAAHGLSGLEGLVGIPGSVGGAVAMNAGSFGCEVGPNLASVRFFDGSQIRDADGSQLSYGYRHMRMPGEVAGYLVLSGTFSLTRKAKDDISLVMRHNFFEKKSKQPVTAWSAGCVFKNPAPDRSAGKLLDAAGYRGKSLGGMMFSPLHANFLVNTGKGSASAAFDLMRMAEDEVRRRFGVTLEPEVRIVS